MKNQLLNQDIQDVVSENKLIKQLFSISICVIFVLIICLSIAIEHIKDLEVIKC